jgi:hypothetical protein
MSALKSLLVYVQIIIAYVGICTLIQVQGTHVDVATLAKPLSFFVLASWDSVYENFWLYMYI